MGQVEKVIPKFVSWDDGRISIRQLHLLADVTNASGHRQHQTWDEDDDENDNGSVTADLLPFARGSQSTVEEFGGGAVGADAIAPAEQVVNFVGSYGNADVLNDICSVSSILIIISEDVEKTTPAK